MSQHWTVQQSEEAARTPEWARPFCWHCRKTMVWRGVWVCPSDGHNRQPGHFAGRGE